MINKVKNILEISKSTMPKLGFKFSDQTQTYAVALWGTIMEYAASLLKLIDEKSTWGIESLLRTMVEAYFDLINLSHIVNYDKRMEMNYYIEANKLEKERHQNPKNEYLSIIDDHSAMDFESQIQKLKEIGIQGKTSIFEKMKLANSENIYRSVYWILSQQGHNNLIALVDRHIITDQNGQPSGIEFFRPKKEQNIIVILDSTAGMLTASMKALESILEIDLKNQIEKAQAILKEIRE